jgi:hypothetical protein
MSGKDDIERSKSGAPVYRHQERDRDFELAFGHDKTIERIGAHIEKYVGKVDFVFHELLSDLVHVDVHMVPPTPERNFHTLVTSGMSDRPMSPPRDLAECRFAEMMICLPPDWPLSQEDFKDDNHYWPIRWLKTLARLPHEYNTWLWCSHTVPNGDPPQPFAGNTQMCCALILEPLLFDEGMATVQVRPGKTVQFLTFVPLYREEMQLKLDEGFDALIDHLEAGEVTELLDVQRPNTCL